MGLGLDRHLDANFTRLAGYAYNHFGEHPEPLLAWFARHMRPGTWLKLDDSRQTAFQGTFGLNGHSTFNPLDINWMV